MNNDFSRYLREWPFDPTQVNARWVEGEDGQRKVQLRLDLGLFQMETEGRPDGSRPHGYATLLDYYLTREHADPSFTLELLSEEDCAELQQEAVQFYYRYLCMYTLTDLSRVIRDTQHNLDLIDFVSRHVEDEDLLWQFLQFYTEVKSMHTRAVAEKAAEEEQFELALDFVRQGLDDVRRFWQKNGGEMDVDESQEDEQALLELLDEMEKRRPRSEAETLQRDLHKAIAEENYERAARLRDRLKTLSRK